MTTTTKLNPGELLSRLANSNSSGCLELEEELFLHYQRLTGFFPYRYEY